MHGARLVLAGRTRETLEKTAAELGVETECVAAEASREAALARFGRVDVLVNNAGVNPILKGIERTSLD